MQVQRKKQHYFVVFISTIIPIVLFGGTSLGSIQFALHDSLFCVFGDCKDQIMEDVIWKLRIPRILAAFVGGAGLSLSGVLLQSLFRNQLASPGILGITTGASLGVAMLVMGGLSLGISIYSHDLGSLFGVALIGSLLTTLLIISMIRFVANTTSLLLVGLMINLVLGSVISVLGVLAQQQNLQFFYMWTLGSFSGMTWDSIHYLYAVVPIVAAVTFLVHKKLDALLLGDSYATSMGINTKHLQKVIVGLSSILTAIVTATAGPIGFIGIAGPYLARLTTNSGSHKTIILLSILYGSFLTTGADILARTIMPPIDLPITIITSIIGAPLVILLLVKRKGEGLLH
jgi:iron complex transport system permease protein